MTLKRVLTISLFCYAGLSQAGTLKNGNWTPNACGSLPQAPEVDGSSIDAYNNTLAAVNEWQQASATYFNCLVKEANDDNKTISNAANREQLNHRQIIDALKASLDEARAQFNNR